MAEATLQAESAGTTAPVGLHNIHDALFEVGGIVEALRLMYQGLDDPDAEHGFHMIVENLGDRIDKLKAMTKGGAA